MNLDDSFSDGSGSEEGPEWNSEMSTGDTGEIEEWVGDTGAEEDGNKSVFLEVVKDCKFDFTH